MISAVTVEDALFAWIQAATGIPADRVRWATQDAARPGRGVETPWVSVRVMSVRPIGRDWFALRPAASPAPGVDMELHALGPRAASIRVQCFGAPHGANAPAMLLERLVAAAQLSTRADALWSAGVGVAGFGLVQAIDGMLNGKFEPRAVLDVRLNLTSQASEFTTYIETAEITDDERDVTFEVDSTP